MQSNRKILQQISSKTIDILLPFKFLQLFTNTSDLFQLKFRENTIHSNGALSIQVACIISKKQAIRQQYRTLQVTSSNFISTTSPILNQREHLKLTLPFRGSLQLRQRRNLSRTLLIICIDQSHLDRNILLLVSCNIHNFTYKNIS